jgi:uncharacterized protein with PQ loop repeat
MINLSKCIGWIGISLGIFISVPQVIKSIRTKSTQGVSKLTYILLLLACVCYTVRAMAIKEIIFIVSNAFQIIVAGTMLYLMRKYKKIIKCGFRETYGIMKVKKASENLDAKS